MVKTSSSIASKHVAAVWCIQERMIIVCEKYWDDLFLCTAGNEPGISSYVWVITALQRCQESVGKTATRREEINIPWRRIYASLIEQGLPNPTCHIPPPQALMTFSYLQFWTQWTWITNS